MRNERNTYIISKALKNYVLASILTAAATQLASSFDAIVLAQFEGEEAVSALSLVMPVTTLVSCLGLLFAFGANAMAARAVGHHDLKRASAVFSTAVWAILILGTGASLLIYMLIPQIVGLVAPDDPIGELPEAYLKVYLLGAWLEMLSYALCLFVATDGHPRRVALAVFVGVLVNAAVDVLAVGWFEWGIQGVAWGTLSQFAVSILLLGLYLRQPACSYTLLRPGRRLYRRFVDNVREGAPVTIGNILMSLTVLLVNGIVYEALGNQGLFFWSVCLQMLLLSVVFINGVLEAEFAIGGVMLGEHDLRGLDLLSRRALLTVGVLVALLMLMMWIPDVVGALFGVEDRLEMAELNRVMRIFSPALLPFSLTMILMGCYQVMGRVAASVVAVVGQQALMVACVALLSLTMPRQLWWGFLVADAAFLAGLLLCSYTYSRRHGNHVSGLTLIPYSEGGHTQDCSVGYSIDEVTAVLSRIRDFLGETGVDRHNADRLILCCEELMTNIVQHSTGRAVNHSFDVHVFVMGERVRIALKDGGRPFNPTAIGRRARGEVVDGDIPNLGLLIAANVIDDISYKYMYGLNMVLIKI